MVGLVGACCWKSWYLSRVFTCLQGVGCDRFAVRTRLLVGPCFLVALHASHCRHWVGPRQAV